MTVYAKTWCPGDPCDPCTKCKWVAPDDTKQDFTNPSTVAFNWSKAKTTVPGVAGNGSLCPHFFAAEFIHRVSGVNYCAFSVSWNGGAATWYPGDQISFDYYIYYQGTVILHYTGAVIIGPNPPEWIAGTDNKNIYYTQLNILDTTPIKTLPDGSQMLGFVYPATVGVSDPDPVVVNGQIPSASTYYGGISSFSQTVDFNYKQISVFRSQKPRLRVPLVSRTL